MNTLNQLDLVDLIIATKKSPEQIVREFFRSDSNELTDDYITASGLIGLTATYKIYEEIRDGNETK